MTSVESPSSSLRGGTSVSAATSEDTQGPTELVNQVRVSQLILTLLLELPANLFLYSSWKKILDYDKN